MMIDGGVIMGKIKDFILALGLDDGISFTSPGDICPEGRQGCKFTCIKTGGDYLYNCYRNSCECKGRIKGKRDTSTIINYKNNDKISKVIRELPDRIVKLPEWAEDMLIKYNSFGAYERGQLKVKYDPKLNRMVCLCGEVAIGRLLVEDEQYKDRPKWYRYDDTGLPFIIDSTPDVAVIVEDVFSAAAVSDISMTGIALMGTELPISYLMYLANYDRLIVALDKDATIKALKIKKELDLYCKDVKVLMLEKDLKDSTLNERLDILV